MLIPFIVTMLLSASPIKNVPTDKAAAVDCDTCNDIAWIEYMLCLDRAGVDHTVECTRIILKRYTTCEAGDRI
jgi:hypothetical protein